MELTTMDTIHEETWAVKKAESEAFIATAKAVLAESGVLDQEVQLSKTKLFPTLVENIFTNMENEDHLFALKLALFELPEIRESENVEAKTALRKGTNKIDILKHAFEITGILAAGGPATIAPEVVEDALDAQQDQIAAESKIKKKAAIMKNINKSKPAKVTSKKEKK